MRNPRDLSLADLLLRLPLGQLYGLIAAIVVVLGAAVGVGAHLSGADPNLEKQFDAASFENNFFKSYLRYISWSTPALGDPSLTLEQRAVQLDHAKRDFVTMAKQLFDEANSLTPTVHKVKYRADKGVNDEVGVITFEDGTSWRIPPEIKREVHH
jgi:hypothetical protein